MSESLLQEIKSIESQLTDCLAKDIGRFKRRIKQLRQQQRGKGADAKAVDQLKIDVQASVLSVRSKQQRLPSIEYPPELPLAGKVDEIRQAIEQHQVVVVCGETGSGKTTQLPKICLEMGRGLRGVIGHTQPRRLAARTVAARIAEELKTELGQAVGYKIRFNDKTSAASYIKLMTDGVLLAEIQHSPLLKHYDTLIIDEAHERSLNIDFLLGYLKRILPKRPDLKVIITSATIDPEKFSRHFDDAPIIMVSGRTYPVEERYRPVDDESISDAIADAVDELLNEEPGDILVFLSGERDIREAADILRRRQYRHTEILPLLARLSAQEQNRIFHPGGQRRIVLATNVAETSLTVPGIRYVIDTGLARISRYSFRSKMQRLPIEKISQAAANQRKGRCGRLSAGICIRLYDEDDFNDRPEFTDAEIHRTNLAAVILQMAYAGMGEIESFPFIDAPDQRQVNDGLRMLKELQAYDDDGITALGRQLAQYPVDPQLARMLIEAKTEGSLAEVLVIVSALAIQDPRERPMDKQQAADEKHQSLMHKKSDFMFYLNLWTLYGQQRKKLSHNKLRQWCRTHFLNTMRMREWQDVYDQLHDIIKQQHLKLNQQEADYDAIHRALVSGLLGHAGLKQEDDDYLGARGRKFRIFPGSSLFKKNPKWLVAAEIVETGKVYARHCAVVQPQWLENKAKHILKYSYAEPHWQRKRAQVAAYESAALYGLVLYAQRKVNYGPIDPVAARHIFIWALVHHEVDSRAEFIAHNRALIDEINTLEAKSRRRDVLVDEQVIYDFYNQRIPEGIYNGPSFERWWRDIHKQQPELLNLNHDIIMQHDASTVSSVMYPDQLDMVGLKLQLEYHFDPRNQHDGVSLLVPLMALRSVNAQRCEWLVPGLLKDKIIGLIRSLPKNIRRNFVPVPEFAEACMESLQPADVPLATALAQQLQRMTGVVVPFDAWRPELLDDYLFMNFRVLDVHGNPVTEGKDLLQLQQDYADAVDQQAVPDNLKAEEIDEVTNWDFGDISEPRRVTVSGVDMPLYPALKKEGKRVALRLFENESLAQQAMRSGLRQLVRNQLPEQMRYLQQQLPGIQSLCLYFREVGGCRELTNDIVDKVIDQAILTPPPQNAEQFEQALEKGRGQLLEHAERVCTLLETILELYHQIRKSLKNTPINWLEAAADVQDQLSHLISPHFIVETDHEQLQHYARYLRAINIRLEKLTTDFVRDRALRLQIQPYWDKYKQRAETLKQQQLESEALTAFRWMIEEYRVSLFAQQLKTAQPVSDKRLNKQWQQVTLGH